MSTLLRRRSLSVRGWLVLAAVSVFLVVVPTGLVIIYVFGFGEAEPQDRAAHAATVLREGAGRWHDPAWHEAVAADLGDDEVRFVLFEDGDELYDSTNDVPTEGAAPPVGGRPWDADRDDGVVRFVEIEGTEPRLTAEIYTPLDDDDLLTTALFAAFLIGTGGAAVALAFGRPFVRPLRAAQDAVRRVTDGDLTAAFPRSRVTEIDDVGTAFGTMTTELRRSLEQQAALEHERRMFIAAIAHDLRTPLFSLRGYLDGLDTGLADTPQRRARYLAVAREKADTLERLVGDLFDYTRLEHREQSLDRQRLDLADLLGELVDGLRPRAEAADVALAFRSPDRDCTVAADRHLLARAVDNILDNAVRHTPEGGRIDVTCGTSDDNAWFTITDTGPGIAADDLPHLFQPLYRGDRSRGGAGSGGSGLGLAIAHRVVTAHDGTMVAGNTPTGGASFTATLPSGTFRGAAPPRSA
jgi:signal transduction histidine kinase